MTPEDIIWGDVSQMLFITREQFDLAIVGLDVKGVYRDGELIGAILIDGPEIHCAGNHRGWLTRRVLREHLGGILKQYGHAITLVPKRDQVSQRFAERLGFQKVSEDEYDIHYRMERMNHE